MLETVTNPDSTSDGGWRVVPRRAAAAADWDALAAASDDAWLWHRHAFGDALATWPDASDESFALVAADDQLAAIMPMTVTEFTRVRGRLRFAEARSLGGPAAADWLGPKQAGAVRRAAIEHARAIATRRRVVNLEVSLPPLAPAFRGDACPRVNPLLELGLENSVGQTWMVDLRPGVDAVWQGMEGRARTAARKAEREGVTVREAAGAADLDVYYELHRTTYERTGLNPHPRAYFETLWNRFEPAGDALALFAEQDGHVVAAQFFGLGKRGAWYWTAASTDAALRLGAPNLIQTDAMRRFAESGYEWYDTGSAYLGPEQDKSRRISDFKRSMGGELYPAFNGRLRMPPRSFQALAAIGELRRAVSPR